MQRYIYLWKNNNISDLFIDKIIIELLHCICFDILSNIERNRPLVEIGNFAGLEKIIMEDYVTYSGMTLELYFKQKLQESFEFRAIGSWWEPKGTQNEIDMVAVYLDNKRALVVEVKRQKKNFKSQAFEEKVKLLRSKEMYKY